MNNYYDAIVIGGGIHGNSVAFNLAQNNLKVLVLEKDYCGRHASGVNAGGVRRLGRDYREIELSQLSATKYWANIENFLDDDCVFKPVSQIKIAVDDESEAFQRNRVNEVEKMGFNHEKFLSKEALLKILPNVSSHAKSAIMVEGDGHANPFKTTVAIKNKALKFGVIVKENEEVINIEGNDKNGWSITSISGAFKTKYIINCAGGWGNHIASFFNESIPFNINASLLSITSKVKSFLKPVIGFQGRVLSLKQFENGSFMIGGGLRGSLNIKSNETFVDFNQVKTNVSNACELFPNLKNIKIVRSWGGIEGECIDKIPVISKSQNFETVFHNFGYSAHGFQPAFASAKIISEMLLNQQLSISNVNEFNINRFKK